MATKRWCIVGRPSIIAPNRLGREFTVEHPDRPWVTDITYFRSWQGWLYLAEVESFFSGLKKERIEKRIYNTRELALADDFDYIEVFYNRQRRLSHLGGASPKAFEQASF